MSSEATTMSATALLRQQHDTVKQMFDQLLNAQGPQRTELFDCLRATLATHETAEEIVVYPRLRKLGADGDRVADARIAEEDEAKNVLAKLEKLGPEDDGFDQQLHAFHQAVLDHATAEESEVFPLLERSCPAGELHTMAERIKKAEDMAPTHPHPHGPNSAIGNRLVGPFAKMVDKVRDAMHGDAGRPAPDGP